MNFDAYVPVVADTGSTTLLFRMGMSISKVSLQINAVKFRFFTFYRAMVCCQPALTAKMNNMTVLVRSLVMTSSVYVCQELDVLLPGVSCSNLKLGTLQTFRNHFFYCPSAT